MLFDRICSHCGNPFCSIHPEPDVDICFACALWELLTKARHTGVPDPDAVRKAIELSGEPPKDERD